MTVQRDTRPTVGIAIVNWNSGEQLRECLASIAASSWTSACLRRVVVVDNGSTDGSSGPLNGAALPLHLIRNQENRGFAAACNQAARSVDAADYLLFLNPDTRVESDAVSSAVGFLDDPAHRAVGIVGAQLRDGSGQIARTCARFPTPLTVLTRVLGLDKLLAGWGPSYPMTEWDHRESREVDHVMGAFYVVRRSLFEVLGGFDERFFVYFEDVDFSRRARHAGWRTRYLTEARAYHRGGGTSEQVKDARLFYSLRSRLLYAEKHFSPAAYATIALGMLLAEPIIRLLVSTSRGAWPDVRNTWSAYLLLWRYVLRGTVLSRQPRGSTREPHS